MINKSIIDDVMERFPNYHYELKSIEGNTEINIVRTDRKDEYGSRKIRKVLEHNEDLTVLENVLKSKEG